MDYQYTIEKNAILTNGQVSVYRFSIWGQGSLMQGQTKKEFVDIYDDVEQAQKDYPKASVGFRSANNTYGHLPDENGNTTYSNGVCYHDYDCCPCYPE